MLAMCTRVHVEAKPFSRTLSYTMHSLILGGAVRDDYSTILSGAVGPGGLRETRQSRSFVMVPSCQAIDFLNVSQRPVVGVV